MSTGDTPREQGASNAGAQPAPGAGAPARLRALSHHRNAAWVAAAVVVMVGGTIASIVGAQGMARSNADKARLAFHLNSAEVAATLKLAIQHEEDLVINASAFVAGNPGASPAAFDRWVESVHALPRYPELQDMGLIRLIPAAGLAAFERAIARNPVLPLGVHAHAPSERFQVFPGGSRPFYCFAASGRAIGLSSRKSSLRPPSALIRRTSASTCSTGRVRNRRAKSVCTVQ